MWCISIFSCVTFGTYIECCNHIFFFPKAKREFSVLHYFEVFNMRQKGRQINHATSISLPGIKWNGCFPREHKLFSITNKIQSDIKNCQIHNITFLTTWLPYDNLVLTPLTYYHGQREFHKKKSSLTFFCWVFKRMFNTKSQIYILLSDSSVLWNRACWANNYKIDILASDV